MNIEIINERLSVLINECREDTLREAMRYSVFAGGKRLRPQLLLAACESVAGSFDASALDFACAVEMIHTYSLIHDDLPAMDDDDYRRGIPTCHKQFGEAVAILAGDALLSHALEHMARVCSDNGRKCYTEAMLLIIRAAGANGMVAGQVSDMEWENKTITGSALLHIHERKTGALITACLTAGARLGGGTDACVHKMEKLGRILGLAFQIRDDILDVTATAADLGKPVHSDEKNRKNTYVSVHGLEKAQTDYRRFSDEATALLQTFPQKTEALRTLIGRITTRMN